MDTISYDELLTISYEMLLTEKVQKILNDALYEPTEKYILYYVDTPGIFQRGFIEGFLEAERRYFKED